MARLLALLRAVNVGGRKMPMAELRALCTDLGWSRVDTYIQSGNLLFDAAGPEESLAATLETAIAGRFGFHSDVVLRTAAGWERLLQENPFPTETETESNRVLAGLARRGIADGAATALMAKAKAGEKVVQTPGALWFHYSEGVGTSKLTPAAIDKAAGSPVTARNWRTLIKLQEMLAS